MKILFVSWEMAPFFKVGGLGDVAGSLPGALSKKSIDIKAVMPFYQCLKAKGLQTRLKGEIPVIYADKNETVKIYEIKNPVNGVDTCLLENAYLDKPEGVDTFAFFDLAVVEMAGNGILGFVPDIIHCNDYHSGLIPLLLKIKKYPSKSLITIHNLAFQGILEKKVFKRLNAEYEYKHRHINMLEEGILHADLINTVSPAYAGEIIKKEYGYGLHKILKARKRKIFGILNGIEIHWKDNVYVKTPHTGNFQTVKKENKLKIQKKFNLVQNENIPVISYVGRLDANQKGIDIFYKMVQSDKFKDTEFLILGTGDKNYEEKFQKLARNNKQRIYANLGFNNEMAHEIYASSDFIVVPSRYEPCGLVQMIAMHYGTLPIARKTGGLADSIIDGKNGFLFKDYSAEALIKITKKALEMYIKDKKTLGKMIKSALKTDFSWEKSAEEYIALYNKLISNITVLHGRVLL